MAVLKVCCVYDSAVESFGQPFFVPHVGAATRSFADEVNRQDSEIGKHPQDYELYFVGEFDQVTGSFLNCSNAERLVRAVDLVNNQM